MSSSEEEDIESEEEEEEESSGGEAESEEEEEEEESEESEEEEKVVVKKRKKGKKKKDPNKPKRNMSAFFLFSNANRERVKRENPTAKFGDIAKIMSNEFKQLSEKEAKKWNKKAAKDKIRYQEEMKNYTPPSDDSDSDDEPRGKKKKKQKKDPNKPKRNQSAFFLYSNAVRSRVKSENPDAAFGDIAKLISVEFKALSSKERAKWDKAAAKDKVRYQREMADYEG
uniref:HMG box domain-containing protein n=1 Tax=Helicotheca tamesis TaxID=374047 RepID=A0A7S2GRI5_9STRA|mmetsp:Transcript_113/g.123  ORF Transcript_113/g.123 Transcript_113/m.123 type:complete len:226 (+) Transcript_113:110-787(+)|eukprot:CAMPEP_0185733732 /NCGR_PEP_ID=MMETSP1171-20130828/20382_1 /TAXON_ID=374046 /ORGANISM="Helicotheca tamensis, Strain CCMP826" /LENGTH=225 /DNA_ID=CAMNT_0028403533 /DNA_START=94 /DNA_END=771 /DNA_ORIENTATION=-